MPDRSVNCRIWIANEGLRAASGAERFNFKHHLLMASGGSPPSVPPFWPPDMLTTWIKPARHVMTAASPSQPPGDAAPSRHPGMLAPQDLWIASRAPSPGLTRHRMLQDRGTGTMPDRRPPQSDTARPQSAKGVKSGTVPLSMSFVSCFLAAPSSDQVFPGIAQLPGEPQACLPHSGACRLPRTGGFLSAARACSPPSRRSLHCT